MSCIAFCSGCGSDRLEVTGTGPKGITVRCYVCTKSFPVEGLILGEVDFLAGAKQKVEAMIVRAREQAGARAKHR